MRSMMAGVGNRARSAPKWLVVIALFVAVSVGTPARVVAEEQEGHEAAGEEHGTAEEHEGGEEHGGEHHHKNHFAVFVGSTEAEEHHGEKGDPDFTMGLDYERRLNKWFGAGAMLDFVVEGQREYLVGPLFILHAGRNAKLFAAPCYQRVRESDDGAGFAFRMGFSWDFYIRKGKNTIFPAIYYDITEEQNFLVLGVGFGLGW